MKETFFGENNLTKLERAQKSYNNINKMESIIALANKQSEDIQKPRISIKGARKK